MGLLFYLSTVGVYTIVDVSYDIKARHILSVLL